MMLPLPYSGDIELISDMLEDLAQLRQEMNEEEAQQLMDEQEAQECWEDAA